MRATHSKKVGTGSNKRPEKLNVHIRNSWRTNLQLIRSIGNMIGYKKSLSGWQCLSEVKMGRGSPIPPMLRRKIVEQYQKGVSQRKIAKSLKLSSSTVHNIIQRFRESGTISVRKSQGRKTILDARDLRALRRHCITYRNATVMEITTWAQEYFQKTLSVNTIHRAIRRCRLKLYRSKKKPYLNMIQKRRRFLWAKTHLKWTVAKWKTVLWSDESKFEVLFGKLGQPKLLSALSSEACISDGMGLHECVWHGQLTHLERHHQCWKVYPSSRTTYAPIQTSSLSGKTLHFPTWQCQTTYCINYNIMAA